MRRGASVRRVLPRPLLAILLASLFLAHEGRCAEPELLPDGFVAAAGFEPGAGPPVGTVEAAQGRVLLLHAGARAGYAARSGLPLYRGDAVVCLEGGRVRLRLVDGSMLTVLSRSRLVLLKVLHDRQAGERSSLLGLTAGDARFTVEKLTGLRRSEFRVKTRTAVAGVRGSDFVVETHRDSTRVTTFDRTELEVISTARPELGPVELGEFERTDVVEGAPATPPERVPHAEIERLREVFTVAARGEEPGGERPAENRRAAAEEQGRAAAPPRESLVPAKQVLGTPPPAQEDVPLPPLGGVRLLQEPDPVTDLRNELRTLRRLPDFPGAPPR